MALLDLRLKERLSFCNLNILFQSVLQSKPSSLGELRLVVDDDPQLKVINFLMNSLP